MAVHRMHNKTTPNKAYMAIVKPSFGLKMTDNIKFYFVIYFWNKTKREREINLQ